MRSWNLQINEKKSTLKPIRKIKFLGYEISKAIVSIPKNKA